MLTVYSTGRLPAPAKRLGRGPTLAYYDGVTRDCTARIIAGYETAPS